MGLKINKNITRIPKIIGWTLLVILFLLMSKILIWENNYYKTKSSEERADTSPVLTDIHRTPYPSEEAPTSEQIKDHQVETDQPRYLDIPRLGILARVFRSEVNEQTLPTPNNIHDTIWYAGSARPGQGRTIIISGLNAGPSEPGVFSNLQSLEAGDEIKIYSGNNFTYIYKVAETRLIESKKLPQELCIAQKQIDKKETLSLITALQGSATDPDNPAAFESVAIVRATLESTDATEQ